MCGGAATRLVLCPAVAARYEHCTHCTHSHHEKIKSKTTQFVDIAKDQPFESQGDLGGYQHLAR